jgi:hypothetical protein
MRESEMQALESMLRHKRRKITVVYAILTVLSICATLYVVS